MMWRNLCALDEQCPHQAQRGGLIWEDAYDIGDEERLLRQEFSERWVPIASAHGGSFPISLNAIQVRKCVYGRQPDPHIQPTQLRCVSRRG
jgi:hypothetical protein